MRDMTEQELLVTQALFDGELGPLSNLLRLENPDVHPLVQRQIRKLIEGSSEQVDFKLTLQPLPSPKGEYIDAEGKRRKNRSHHAQARRDAEGIKIAQVMVRHGALEPSSWDAAVECTMAELSIGRTKVTSHWSEQKGFMEFMQRSSSRSHAFGLTLPE